MLTTVLIQFWKVNKFFDWNPQGRYDRYDQLKPVYSPREYVERKLMDLSTHPTRRVFFEGDIVSMDSVLDKESVYMSGWDDTESPWILAKNYGELKVNWVRDQWFEMCEKSVSVMIDANTVGGKNGFCPAWRKESQQIFCDKHYKQREGIWNMKASVFEGRITQINVNGIIDKFWIRDVLAELKRFRSTEKETPNLQKPYQCDVSIDQNLTHLSAQIKRSTELEREVLRQYLIATWTRYTNQGPVESLDLFKGWQLLHNRGLGLSHILKPKYREIREAIANVSDAEGTLLPVTEFARWITIIAILFSTLAVFLAVYVTGPPKECQIAGCHNWVRSDAIIWSVGFLLSLITTSELLFGAEKGIGGLCRGRIRMRGWRPIRLWCGVTKAQILSLQWLDRTETENGILNGDIEGNSLLRLALMSDEDYDFPEGVSWKLLPYSMRFGGFKYDDVKHLCYIDRDGFALTASNWRALIQKNASIYVDARKNRKVRSLSIGEEEKGSTIIA